MKFIFKQRFFSWLDSYDIFDEYGNTLYTVKGELAFGHMFNIYDAGGNQVGCIKEKVFTWLPKFEIYMDGRCIGCIKKEFSLFKAKFTIDLNGFRVVGDLFEWDYTIINAEGRNVATVTKELFNFTDTYSINVENPSDALCALMLVLAIDAEKCSRGK